MENPLYYLAYGSNLHPVRLGKRVPSAKLLDTVELSGYEIRFHKRSKDGSGKCNLFYTGNSRDKVHAAVYKIPALERGELDKAEGLGCGYEEKEITVEVNGEPLRVFTYVATDIKEDLQPYHWYRELVIEGARYHDFLPTYIAALKAVDSKDDPNLDRVKENQNLLEEMGAKTQRRWGTQD